LINSSPQIVMLAFDRQKYLIQMPFIPWPRTAATELVCILSTKLATPLADRLIGHSHPSFQQQLFYIPETQAEPEIQLHGMADNFDGKTVVLILDGRRRGVHALITSYLTAALQASQEVDNAFRWARTWTTAKVPIGTRLPRRQRN